MKRMRKIVKRSLPVATLVVLAALTMAGVNPQAYSAPANVAVSNTAEGYVLVRWENDGAPIHRVGWTQETELRAAQAAGDWLEAFHFADTRRATDYAVKYLPGGQLYWFIVGAGGERFGPVTWGEWNSLTTVGSTPPSQPTAMPTPVEETGRSSRRWWLVAYVRLCWPQKLGSSRFGLIFQRDCLFPAL